MTKEKLTISTIITIATVLLSLGGSWAVVKSKADKVDKLEEKVSTCDMKVVVLETKLSNIEEVVKETKESIKEQRSDLKAILKAVKQ